METCVSCNPPSSRRFCWRAGAEITVGDLFGTTLSSQVNRPPASETAATPLTFREAKEQMVAGFEREFLLNALRRNGGNITKAAEEVGMYRQSFQQKMRELGLSAEDAKE